MTAVLKAGDAVVNILNTPVDGIEVEDLEFLGERFVRVEVLKDIPEGEVVADGLESLEAEPRVDEG